MTSLYEACRAGRWLAAAAMSVFMIVGCVGSNAQRTDAALPSSATPTQDPGFDADAALRGPRLSDVRGEPSVRVRVVRGAANVTIATDPAVTIRSGNASPLKLVGPVTFVRNGGVWRMTDARGAEFEFRGQRIDIDPSSTGTTRVNDGTYPGRITLRAAEKTSDGLDAINTVGMETYLPGVLQRELFPSWEPAAFEAQAIAARSYALWEIARSRLRGRAFDLESTTASQAYVGVASNPKARRGAEATRGVVLAWDGRVLPAFYASSHGPYGADAVTTFVDRVADLLPLRGRAHGQRDANSPRFNWQAQRDASELAARLQSWGEGEEHPVARAAAPVRGIVLASRNAAGRHVSYVVTDGHGRRFSIRADQLRHAANHEAPGFPKADRSNMLFSGQFQPVVRGRTVLFLNGHGHGHGVGLSQYGAQAMALQRQNYATILATYYPGTTLVRAY